MPVLPPRADAHGQAWNSKACRTLSRPQNSLNLRCLGDNCANVSMNKKDLGILFIRSTSVVLFNVDSIRLGSPQKQMND